MIKPHDLTTVKVTLIYRASEGKGVGPRKPEGMVNWGISMMMKIYNITGYNEHLSDQ